MKLPITRTVFFILLFSSIQTIGQHSVARQWNELTLDAIRNDFARPTVHSRNLFHISIAMYECWAAYDAVAEQYMLGRDVHGFNIPFKEIPMPEDIKAAQEEAMSYAALRILFHRYRNSPGRFETLFAVDDLFSKLGYDIRNRDTTYQSGVPAHLGNYIAARIIEYGFQDGSNENEFYNNLYYEPINPPLSVQESGNPNIIDLNRWQPLSLKLFIDQSGNEIVGETPKFLGPEWGNVSPFALKEEDMQTYERDGFTYKVYHDPGPPVLLSEEGTDASSAAYKWGNSMVSIWGSHHDPNDGVMIDISPSSIGNFDINGLPRRFEDLPSFYNFIDGGDASRGHAMNPITGQPYEPNIVLRGDYGRVLAEFWADGPDSETPPGHWFTIHNSVTDHPDFKRKLEGEGEELDPLEWDVKAYLTLAGAMHDCTISAWGIKGWYDYIRPVSAIRGIAEIGQSSDENAPNYNPRGLDLIEGYVEQVSTEDALAGDSSEHVGKIKLFTWKGPDFIENPEEDVAGVGWILAENWYPYQRPTFVTPPFAGYVSGHSTFSRAAAEVMTLLTGDPFFPGGIGEFVAEKDSFLVFEKGPSEEVILQWATYRDASDQTSLSRIWGGIHPPIDDAPGRVIGEQIGIQAFRKAIRYFDGTIVSTKEIEVDQSQILSIAPNPVEKGMEFTLSYDVKNAEMTLEMMDIMGKKVFTHNFTRRDFNQGQFTIPSYLQSGIYILSVKSGNKIATRKIEIY
ncbi:MAG: T9SS type A sorting domain-containing protein [Saprospiraceae bacterium]